MLHHQLSDTFHIVFILIVLTVDSLIDNMCLKERQLVDSPSNKNTVDIDIAWNDNYSYVDYDDFLSMYRPDSDLTILQLNIRGLINKQSDLSKLLQREENNKVDVALLCETWIRPKNLNRINIPGYKYESKERKGEKGGGHRHIDKRELKVQTKKRFRN